MRLSVVVPFYNVELYVHDCLASLAGQTLGDLEVILVDDGSQDRSRDIAEHFVETDDRFRIVTQANQGLGPARNTGMREASGDYLTFVDSDDIVPRTAYARMVRRLDRTGSDFAAGNARRFNLSGLTQSWAHREAFATDVRTTSIRDLPVLADDRMVWNKVYRRSFWEAGGYEFPAIMYEDYPVTLRAHLEAASVEVMDTPVYLWRKRDAGETSITQRVYEARNVDDRVTSATMVLEVLDRSRALPEAVRHRVQDNLVSTDIPAVARAVAHPDNNHHVEGVLASAQRLVAAIDEPVLAGRRPLEKVMFELIRRGLVDELRTLIDVRDQLAPPAGHERRGMLRKRRLITLPDRDLSMLPDDLRALEPAKLDLETRVQSARWEGEQQVLGVEAWMNFSGALHAPRLRAWLADAQTETRLPLRVREPLEQRGTHVLAEVEVDTSLLVGGEAAGAARWSLHLQLRDGDLVREGVAQASSGTAHESPPRVVNDWTWLQSGRSHHEFVLRRLVWPVRIDEARSGRTGELVLGGAALQPLPATDVLLQLSDGHDEEFLVPVVPDSRDPRRWSTHLQLDMLQPETPDPYVDLVTSWDVHLLTDGRRDPVGYAPTLPSTRALHGGREVQVLGNRFHCVRIDTMWPRFVVERVEEVDGYHVRLRGRVPDVGRGTAPVAVLRWYHQPLVPVDVRIPMPVEDGWFSLDVDVAELTARMAEERRSRPVEVEAEHAWTWYVERGDTLVAGHLLGGIERALPGRPWQTPHGDVLLTGEQDTAARFELLD